MLVLNIYAHKLLCWHERCQYSYCKTYQLFFFPFFIGPFSQLQYSTESGQVPMTNTGQIKYCTWIPYCHPYSGKLEVYLNHFRKVNENIAMFTELNNHSYLKQNSYLTNRVTAMFITAFLSFTGGCVSGIVMELKSISATGKEPLFIDRQARICSTLAF